MNKFFIQLSPIHPPVGLEGRIIKQIRHEEQKHLLALNGIACAIWTGFLVVCVFFVRALFVAELEKSDFFAIVATVFGEGASFALYWKDSLFAIFESFPVMSVIMTFTTLFVLLWLIRSYSIFIHLSLYGNNKKSYG